jgi:selenocysteine lyase/cysteine desulfurase
LRDYGMHRVAEEEIGMAAYARHKLSELPGVTQYALWPRADIPRLGILTFNVAGFWHSHLAAILSAEYGVGVRHGCFCAHPLMTSLIKIDDSEAARIRVNIASCHKDRVPGAVRISLGLGSTREDIDYVAAALESIIRNGPRWSYRVLEGTADYVPEPETRSWPELPFSLNAPLSHGCESS